MFTGIVEATAHVISLKNHRLVLQRPLLFDELKIGQSIAVNGACLSVMKCDQQQIEFDTVPETLQKTNLGAAQMVNLERALSVNGRFEGHCVLGHVDGTAELQQVDETEKGWLMRFSIPQDLNKYFVHKGSIALNGISLTIADCTNESFTVAIIPHSFKETNLHTLQTGDQVNIEADYFAKLLSKWQTA
jgi:riboflavin synthase